ncbi:MAG: DivIVA domain-containing protein, partial [Actinomycetota bacterium]|nr:DivIVA domain-containing protein [Actinomycetota bacterium]
MALTPEQILNKHFQTTQFRKGYDERDVDDFLDEIVAEMRTLSQQRDDYKQQLNDCRAGRGLAPVSESQQDGAAGGAQAQEAQARLLALQSQIAEAETEEKSLRQRVTAAQSEVESAEAAVKD